MLTQELPRLAQGYTSAAGSNKSFYLESLTYVLAGSPSDAGLVAALETVELRTYSFGFISPRQILRQLCSALSHCAHRTHAQVAWLVFRVVVAALSTEHASVWSGFGSF